MSLSERHFRAEHSQLFDRTHQKTATGSIVGPNALGSGTDSIVLMNNDGTGTTVIEDQNGGYSAVQESPYGNKGVGSAVDDNGYLQIFYADLSNKNNPVITQLTTSSEDHYSPQVSWDGKTVVFMKYVSGEGGRAFLISTSGGNETEISTSFNVSTPSFTPDGKILFEQEDNDSISTMNTDGSNVVQLTNADHPYFDEYPSISADGKTIVFARYPADESGGEDIWTANSDGSNVKQLTTDGLSVDPMFVNNKIVFISWRDSGPNEVYSMTTDGTTQTRLTNDDVSQYFDSW